MSSTPAVTSLTTTYRTLLLTCFVLQPPVLTSVSISIVSSPNIPCREQIDCSEDEGAHVQHRQWIPGGALSGIQERSVLRFSPLLND